MMETIAVYYTPLVATRVLGAVGFSVAAHMAIVYTDAKGVSFGASSGPSDHTTAQTPQHAISALVDMANEKPSVFGALVSDPANNHPFEIGMPNDYYTQDYDGRSYPHVTVATGADLSSAWSQILGAYAEMGASRLTYSPISQNSNSMAGNALLRAGLDIPFSSQTSFAPAVFTRLPRSHRNRP